MNGCSSTLKSKTFWNIFHFPVAQEILAREGGMLLDTEALVELFSLTDEEVSKFFWDCLSVEK